MRPRKRQQSINYFYLQSIGFFFEYLKYISLMCGCLYKRLMPLSGFLNGRSEGGEGFMK